MQAPSDLTPKAKRELRRVVADLEARGVWRPSFEAAAVRYCRALDRADALRADLDGAPLVVAGPRGGQARAHPLLGELRAWEAFATTLADRLLLTPASQGRGVAGRARGTTSLVPAERPSAGLRAVRGKAS